MTQLTVTEIMKATGKSQSTVLRFVRELKQTTPEAVQVEEVGKTRQYKISKDEVQKHFVISEETAKEPQTPNAHQTTPSIPEGYKLIPNETIEALQQQLVAKDEQIKRLQENNHILSGAITSMKMLGTGKPPKKQEVVKEPTIIAAKNDQEQAESKEDEEVPTKQTKPHAKGNKKATATQKTKPPKKKGFWERLFN